MAVYTREIAKKNARDALSLKNYTVVVWLTGEYKVKRTQVVNRLQDNAVRALPKEQETDRIVTIHREDVTKNFGVVTTIKDLEHVLYLLFNKKIAEIQNQCMSEGIYVRDAGGYSKSIARFYKVVKESRGNVTVKPIGKVRIGGDKDFPVVMPDPTKIIGESIVTRSEIGDKLRMEKRDLSGYAMEDTYMVKWDGEPYTESYF